MTSDQKHQSSLGAAVIRAKYLLLLSALFFSCGPTRTITGKDTQVTDSTIVRQIPVQVKQDAATSESPEINYQKLDSMIKAGVNISLINAMLQGKQDPSSKLSARIQVDEKGNLKAICELQERLIEMMNIEIERLRIERTEVTVEVSKSWFQELWDDFKQLIVGALLLLAFLTYRKFLT